MFSNAFQFSLFKFKIDKKLNLKLLKIFVGIVLLMQLCCDCVLYNLNDVNTRTVNITDMNINGAHWSTKYVSMFVL